MAAGAEGSAGEQGTEVLIVCSHQHLSALNKPAPK